MPPLTDTKIKNAKPKDKDYKIYDERGLYLQIAKSGGKLWRFRYTLDSKEKLLALGSYPEISLKAAREKADEARQLVANHKDPMTAKRQAARSIEKTYYAFENVAERWMTKNGDWSDSYRFDTKQRLINHVYPVIGETHINEIEREDLIRCFRRMEAKKLHSGTVRKIYQHTRAIFKYGIAEGACDRCLPEDIEPLLPKGDPVEHQKALDNADIGLFLQKLDAYGGQVETVIALKLLMVTAVRPRNVFEAVWEDFDLENGVWEIPSFRMKMKKLHVVPLPKQIITELKTLHLISGNRKYLFPSQLDPGNGHMSENTLNQAIKKRMGFDATAHGMRSVFSTLANESGFNPDAVEVQLAHIDNTVRGAYMRSKFWEERKVMMQAWADYLDTLKSGIEEANFKAISLNNGAQFTQL